eukprot:6762136-Alexandrium_andersonii.AAC.1
MFFGGLPCSPAHPRNHSDLTVAAYPFMAWRVVCRERGGGLQLPQGVEVLARATPAFERVGRAMAGGPSDRRS